MLMVLSQPSPSAGVFSNYEVDEVITIGGGLLGGGAGTDVTFAPV